MASIQRAEFLGADSPKAFLETCFRSNTTPPPLRPKLSSCARAMATGHRQVYGTAQQMKAPSARPFKLDILATTGVRPGCSAARRGVPRGCAGDLPNGGSPVYSSLTAQATPALVPNLCRHTSTCGKWIAHVRRRRDTPSHFLSVCLTALCGATSDSLPPHPLSHSPFNTIFRGRPNSHTRTFPHPRCNPLQRAIAIRLTDLARSWSRRARFRTHFDLRSSFERV